MDVAKACFDCLGRYSIYSALFAFGVRPNVSLEVVNASKGA